jgi:hypothetical protein
LNSFQDVIVPQTETVHTTANKLRQTGLLLDKKNGPNIKCSLNKKWMKLVSGLKILLIIPQASCIGDYDFKIICLKSHKTFRTQTI